MLAAQVLMCNADLRHALSCLSNEKPAHTSSTHALSRSGSSTKQWCLHVIKVDRPHRETEGAQAFPHLVMVARHADAAHVLPHEVQQALVGHCADSALPSLAPAAVTWRQA